MKLEKFSKKMSVVRCVENTNEKQKANGFLHKVKVKVEETDRDGDLSITYARIPSKVKIDKAGAYELEIERMTFEDPKTKKDVSFDKILDIRK